MQFPGLRYKALGRTYTNWYVQFVPGKPTSFLAVRIWRFKFQFTYYTKLKHKEHK